MARHGQRDAAAGTEGDAVRRDILGDLIIEKAEKLMANAERHRLRGDQHLKDGFPERAAGSYRKADKNIAHATKELKGLETWRRGIKIERVA
jgi:hypothetical protein